MSKKLVRFDWAIKKLLRHKANFTILEGFLSELLKFDVTIESILESEGNKQESDDKFNRVDVLVKTAREELMLVEVQNESQSDYFQRMIYGVSKLITEYIKEGQPYGTIKKVFSINIVYFALGQGEDYIYEYRGDFVGAHLNDVLYPTESQRGSHQVERVADIFLKYFILKVNNFDDVAKDTLDEWIYFLKNSEVKDEFKAKGLQEVKEKLQEEALPEDEKMAYRRYKENRRIERSVMETAYQEGGRERAIEIARNGIAKGYDHQMIADMTGLAIKEIEVLDKEMKK